MARGFTSTRPGSCSRALTLATWLSIFWTITGRGRLLLPAAPGRAVPPDCTGDRGGLRRAGRPHRSRGALPATDLRRRLLAVRVRLPDGSLLAMAVKDLEPLTCGEGRSCRAIRRLADVSAFVAWPSCCCDRRDKGAGSPRVLQPPTSRLSTLISSSSTGVLFTDSVHAHGRGRRARLLRAPAASLPGQNHYSGYLWHMLVLRTYVKLTPIPGSTPQLLHLPDAHPPVGLRFVVRL
jgi:hypothetical protein